MVVCTFCSDVELHRIPIILKYRCLNLRLLKSLVIHFVLGSTRVTRVAVFICCFVLYFCTICPVSGEESVAVMTFQSALLTGQRRSGYVTRIQYLIATGLTSGLH